MTGKRTPPRSTFLKMLKDQIYSLYYQIRFFNKPIDVHPSARISRKAIIRIHAGGSVYIGPRTTVLDFAMIMSYGGRIHINGDCSINPFSILYGHGGLHIGSFVRIAAHTIIIPSNHNHADTSRPIYEQGESSKGIAIGDDVWIGANCTILDGVTIEHGSIIGGGSVVTRNIPPYSIAVGNPARVVRSRNLQASFNDTTLLSSNPGEREL